MTCSDVDMFAGNMAKPAPSLHQGVHDVSIRIDQEALETENEIACNTRAK